MDQIFKLVIYSADLSNLANLRNLTNFNSVPYLKLYRKILAIWQKLYEINDLKELDVCCVFI